LTDTRQHILQTLAYFDIFQYPLKEEEIFLFHGQNCRPMVIGEALRSLVDDKTVFRLDQFYSLHDDDLLASRRRLGNELAAEQMKIAYRAAKTLSRFPYVRGLAISGSLSKNYSTQKTDIDFFIITAANRLWIARTLMHLYKKFTFIIGRQHWFCMNYYIDEAGLEIEEKNIYTAIEIATLLPMWGGISLGNFMLANAWTKKYLPVYRKVEGETPEPKKGPLARLFEKILDGKMGEWLDNKLMQITDKRWQKKVQRNKKNDKGFSIGMMVSKHFSKPNPVFFQDKILEMYSDKVNKLQQVGSGEWRVASVKEAVYPTGH